MKVVEQAEGYEICFEMTKPIQLGFIGSMMLVINILCQLGL